MTAVYSEQAAATVVVVVKVVIPRPQEESVAPVVSACGAVVVIGTVGLAKFVSSILGRGKWSVFRLKPRHPVALTRSLREAGAVSISAAGSTTRGINATFKKDTQSWMSLLILPGVSSRA